MTIICLLVCFPYSIMSSRHRPYLSFTSCINHFYPRTVLNLCWIKQWLLWAPSCGYTHTSTFRTQSSYIEKETLYIWRCLQLRIQPLTFSRFNRTFLRALFYMLSTGHTLVNKINMVSAFRSSESLSKRKLWPVLLSNKAEVQVAGQRAGVRDTTLDGQPRPPWGDESLGSYMRRSWPCKGQTDGCSKWKPRHVWGLSQERGWHAWGTESRPMCLEHREQGEHWTRRGRKGRGKDQMVKVSLRPW